MDEILYELREHSAGLNAGRWDYIFCVIKKFRDRAGLRPARPGAGDDGRTVHAGLHRAARPHLPPAGAHAIGGMAAFIPSRRDPEVNEIALARVSEDKQREATAGFDGTWVAHPDLVPVATSIFDEVLADRPNQLARDRDDVQVAARDAARHRGSRAPR